MIDAQTKFESVVLPPKAEAVIAAQSRNGPEKMYQSFMKNE